MKKNILSLFVLLFVTLTSCSTQKPFKLTARDIAGNGDEAQVIPLIQTLPAISKDNNGELREALKKAIKNRTKGLPEADLNKAIEKFRSYMLFLGLSAKDFKKAETKLPPAESDVAIVTEVKTNEKNDSDDADTGGEELEDKTPSNLKAIQRLFISSMQFLDCPTMIDWECLEKTPLFKPTAEFRNEKTALGSPVNAGEELDMEVFFTQAWDGSPSAKLVETFADKINQDATKSLSIAMYGIDDINASMKSVYDAILQKAMDPTLNVRAVVDVMGFERSTYPWVFNYVDQSNNSAIKDKWIFSPSDKPDATENSMKATFQYDGTANFIRELNKGINTEDESKVRIEWVTTRIMHNKFAVLENTDGEKSVWTGTANISKNCMGIEHNANMAVYIRNTPIANSFLEQFNLMYNFDKSINIKSKLIVSKSLEEPSYAGRFHRNKYPVSKRFFKFDDGTNLRVHFAPTDDAEHRVIIPMLLSARAGDEIRISMFGGTGYEIVRAMQFAAAQGANIRIAFDRRLGHGLTSWIRDSILNVYMPNPYIKPGTTPGKITVRVSTWTGKNHYKAGSLTRKKPDGSMSAETLIVGSQNWSSGGNDFNDENLISIQNLNKEVLAASLFNKEFDQRIWLKSKEEKPKNNIFNIFNR